MKEKQGGFAIEFSKRGKQEFMTIESVSGTWRMTLRGDTEVYQLLKALWDDAHDEKNASAEAFKTYILSYVQMNYICSSITPDEQFVIEFVKSYNEWCERVSATRALSASDTEEEVIQEEIVKHQMTRELEDYERKFSADDSQDVGKDSSL